MNMSALSGIVSRNGVNCAPCVGFQVQERWHVQRSRVAPPFAQRAKTGNNTMIYRHRMRYVRWGSIIGQRITCSAVSVGAVEEWCQKVGSPGIFMCSEGSDEDVRDSNGGRTVYLATQDVEKGAVVISMPGDVAVTITDVEQDEELRAMTEGRSELVCLAIFVAKHKNMGDASPWSILMESLPESVDSPVFWSEDERARLLRGSPVAEESRSRNSELQKEWESLESIRPSWLTKNGFSNAMSVVLSHAVFLPAVSCFALLPILGDIQKTGSGSGASIDYDVNSNMVTVTSSMSLSAGDAIQVFDGRPNGEIFMATGYVEKANPADYLVLNASLVVADRLYTMKEEVANAMGFSKSVDFPIYQDRLAIQHLAYLRMSRITDAAQMAKANFEEDVIISQENEYEILQLVMGDLREWLQQYEGGLEEDVKELQRTDLSHRDRMATMLTLGEKKILRGTMDGVRKRLAPIRGIPTKSGGLEDPNSDLVEIFDAIEAIPSAPKKLWQGLQSWAKGDQDPNWKR